MPWNEIPQEELDAIMLAIKWLEIRARWDKRAAEYPAEVDVIKSSLFDRMRSGLEPLDFPPPTNHSYPWYSIVEDLKPHNVGLGGKYSDIHFSKDANEKSLIIRIAEEYKHGTVNVGQHTYEIYEEYNEKDFIIRDTEIDPENEDIHSPYLFRLYWEPNYELKHVHDGTITKENVGCWMMYNTKFNV